MPRFSFILHIDRLVIGTFAGPFILTFFISLFVLVMQFLWKYIDEMIGKGLEILMVLELLFYSSASMVPLALPLAVLLSSIMTFGTLAEHNELTAMKSSGISLVRIMLSLIITVFLISTGAFLFSNYMLPYCNLKFGALLYDIRNQKPALNIKEGIFYNGFEGYSMKVGKKDKDNRTVYDIMIYDHSSGLGNDNLLMAKKGEMMTTEDKQYLVLKLYDGTQYQDMHSKEKKKEGYQYTKTFFQSWEKAFDLSAFKMSRTDEELFRDHYQMLSLQQLKASIDTLYMEEQKSITKLKEHFAPHFYFMSIHPDSLFVKDSSILHAKLLGEDSLKEQTLTHISAALRNVRNLRNFSYIISREMETKKAQIIRSEIEWHRKFTLSVACFILFLIGGPLGAIIKKGGLGAPLVVAVCFFIAFHVLSIIGEKSAKEMVMSSFWGMWIAPLILLPIGIILTYRVMYDSLIFSMEWYMKIFEKIMDNFITIWKR